MSALAQYYKNAGIQVSGSDRAQSPVTDMLVAKGIEVMFQQQADNVPADAELVVYSDAVSEDHPERVRARELGIRSISYFGALGELTKKFSTIAVAGTHGKTTTTGMLAKILIEAGVSPHVIVGSILKDFQSNYIAGTSETFVVEACEYRNHLLELSPRVLVITNLEWDHTDWFPSLEALQQTFRTAIERVPEDGAIITDPSNANIAPLLASAKARIIDYTKEATFELHLPGTFNQMNARAASAAAKAVSPALTDDVVSRALGSFHGTWRRFEYKGTTENGARVYDDYAHHPTAIRATLHALRGIVSGPIVVAFHPHLYSRTKDLFEDFANAFADADLVYLAPIYAAREEDDGSVSSDLLAKRITELGTHAVALDIPSITAELLKLGGDTTIITMGAGDIYTVADAITTKI